jgi:hypothetical protein
MQTCPICGGLFAQECPDCTALLQSGDKVLTDWRGDKRWCEVVAIENRQTDQIIIDIDEQPTDISRAYVLGIRRERV